MLTSGKVVVGYVSHKPSIPTFNLTQDNVPILKHYTSAVKCLSYPSVWLVMTAGQAVDNPLSCDPYPYPDDN